MTPCNGTQDHFFVCSLHKKESDEKASLWPKQRVQLQHLEQTTLTALLGKFFIAKVYNTRALVWLPLTFSWCFYAWMRVQNSSCFCRNTSCKDLSDVRVILGKKFLLHSPELRLHLFFTHVGNRKWFRLVQKVLDQVFPHLKDKQYISFTILSKTIALFVAELVVQAGP